LLKQNVWAFLADVPAKCTTIAHTLEKKEKELSDARRELGNLTSELAAVKEVREVLFALVEKLWTLLCTYEHEQGATHREHQTLESVLDLALARFDLLGARIDSESLRRENCQLRAALQMGRAQEANTRPVAQHVTEDHTGTTTSPSNI
jgi:chromosome segregation ATPase